MPNCRRAAGYLAEAFMVCDGLKDSDQHWELRQPALKQEVENLEGYLGSFFSELSRRPFENYDHDIANLKAQSDSEHPQSYFLSRYAEDLQKQMINQGILDVIDCQCKRG